MSVLELGSHRVDKSRTGFQLFKHARKLDFFIYRCVPLKFAFSVRLSCPVELFVVKLMMNIAYSHN